MCIFLLLFLKDANTVCKTFKLYITAYTRNSHLLCLRIPILFARIFWMLGEKNPIQFFMASPRYYGMFYTSCAATTCTNYLCYVYAAGLGPRVLQLSGPVDSRLQLPQQEGVE